MPLSIAQCKEVIPLSSAAFGFAPWSSRYSAKASWALALAITRAVMPIRSGVVHICSRFEQYPRTLDIPVLGGEHQDRTGALGALPEIPFVAGIVVISGTASIHDVLGACVHVSSVVDERPGDFRVLFRHSPHECRLPAAGFPGVHLRSARALRSLTASTLPVRAHISYQRRFRDPPPERRSDSSPGLGNSFSTMRTLPLSHASHSGVIP